MMIIEINKMFFKLREAIWWMVAELEDVLYPYYDRPVQNWRYPDVDEESEFDAHMQSANDRIERLQSEMLYVQEEIVKLKNRELP